MSRPLSEVRREAEEALATVAQRYPNGWGSYDTLSICTSALRALLAEPAGESGSVSTVRSDDPPAKPLPTCCNCGSNFITPAPAPCDGPRRDALRADLLARADAAGDPITSFLSGAAPVAPVPFARRLRERVDVAPPCPYCGAYASRCNADRDDGSTVCAMTGRTVRPAEGASK